MPMTVEISAQTCLGEFNRRSKKQFSGKQYCSASLHYAGPGLSFDPAAVESGGHEGPQQGHSSGHTSNRQHND